MNWNLTRRQYMADFYVVPAFAIAALAICLIRSVPALTCIAHIAAGFLVWTLAEYVIHRFGFHSLYRRDHARHHAKPLEWIGVTPLVSLVALALAWLVCYWAARDAGRGSSGFLGFALGYYGYIGIHYLIHHSNHSWLARLRDHHVTHHRSAGSNFGVSVQLWDRVFCTLKKDGVRGRISA